MRTTLGIVYTICGLLVLLAVYSVWGHRSDSPDFSNAQYLSYEELQASKENWQYPDGWQFMEELDSEMSRTAEKRRETDEALRRFKKLNGSGTESLSENGSDERTRREVEERISQIAENLRFQKENMEKRPIPPILKIWKMRHSEPKTYDLDGLESEDWEISDFEKQTGRQISDMPYVPHRENPIEERQDREGAKQTDLAISSKISQGGTEAQKRKNPYFVFKTAEDEMKKEPRREESELLLDTSKKKIESGQEIVRGEKSFSSSKESLENGDSNVSSEAEALISLPDELSDSEQWEEEDPNDPYCHEEGLLILRYFNQKARQRLATYLDEIRDYSGVLYKWDQSNTSLDGQDVIWFKLREEPFSFYGKNVFPKKTEGREILFWEGHYDEMLIVNSGPNALNRTLAFDMNSNTVKKAGPKGLGRIRFSELLREMEELSRDESRFENTQIRYFKDAKVGEEKCYAIQITYDESSGNDIYRLQIYVTHAHDLPVKIVFYDWPKEGKKPDILESYLFVITELNPGYEDMDFCHLNPAYGFKRYIPRLSQRENEFMERLYEVFKKREAVPARK
ncbi:MAG: DUF1571 domain-containing protein [Planctomycetaceae bacterium]|nr:DUF1571 domain-containing protein [Planctomycetaceae bacterium]